VRIAITGIGVVSTFGVGRETFWDNVSRGVSGTRAITEFDASRYPCRVAAAVPAFTLEPNGNGNGHGDPKRYSRAARFGVVAAREA
jgi:3-oxoacyl-(acyl-carrier-protein) synthase